MSESIQAQDDFDGLRQFVSTAAKHALPDDYEARVTVGFMRGLLEHGDQLEGLRRAVTTELAMPLHQRDWRPLREALK